MVVFDAFYILFINHDLYVLLWYVFLIYKILMIEKQLLQIDLGFEGTNYWLEQKKRRVNLMSVQQVGPLLDFMIPFSLREAIWKKL
jgi:hypothetical protein